MEMFRSFQTNKHVDVCCYLPIAVSSVTTGVAWRSGIYGATVKGAEVAYHATLDRLTMQLIEDHLLSVVDLKLKKVVRRKKENAAATYLYQADCDGRWSEVYIVFKNKYIKIERFALDLA